MLLESSADNLEFIDMESLRDILKNPIHFLCAVENLIESRAEDIYDEQISGLKKDTRENMHSIKRLFEDYLVVKEQQEKIEEANMEIICRICNKKFKPEILKAHSTLCLERMNLLRELNSTNEQLQKLFDEVKAKKSEMIRNASKISRAESKKRDLSTDLSEDNSMKDSRRHSTFSSLSNSVHDSPSLQKSFFFKIKEGEKRDLKHADSDEKPKISNSEDLLPLQESLTEERSDISEDKQIFTDPIIKANKTPTMRRQSKGLNLSKESSIKKALDSPASRLKSSTTSSTGNLRKPIPNMEFKERELKKGAKILEEILNYVEKVFHEQGDYNLSSSSFLLN